MPHIINLMLSYSGEEAENHQLDFYDTAQALIGFERSLALTTHLILNGKIITQAPSLAGAKIYVIPPENGSWTIVAGIVTVGAAALYKLGTAPRDTPLGHFVSSVYEYLIMRTLGFVVDYEQSLGRQYHALRQNNPEIGEITEHKMDSLIEKTETAIKMMHRPIVESETADKATIISVTHGAERKIARALTRETYDRMQLAERTPEVVLDGRVSSYNINTYRGRIYVDDEQRPIPFELTDAARDDDSIAVVAASLVGNATNRIREGSINFHALKVLSKTGRLKALLITQIN